MYSSTSKELLSMNQTWLTTNQMVFSSLIFLFSFKNTLIDSSNLLHLFNFLYSITRLHVQNAYRNILEGYETLASLVHEAIQLATFACSACSENKGEKKKTKGKKGKRWNRRKERERRRMVDSAIVVRAVEFALRSLVVTGTIYENRG